MTQRSSLPLSDNVGYLNENIRDFVENTRMPYLSLGHRILLVQKGTVEAALEIIMGEKIGTKVIKQTEDNGIVKRRSLLHGLDSGVAFVRAASQISAKFLPNEFTALVRQKQLGIGKIIERTRLETCYVFLGTGREKRTLCPYREYQVIHKNKVVMKIRETILI